MKKTFAILLLLIACATGASAQRIRHRGIALGADRDTLLYIIASPFDNWWLNVGGGLQTFIGNEVESAGRRNKLNYNVSAEIGKWIIPDLAVSFRLNFFSVDGKSRYPLQPFIDYSNSQVDTATGYYDYHPFHAHAVSAMGYVTLDWTNLFNGYEQGKRRHLHWYSPIGLGMSMLFGTQKNPNPRTGYELGSFRRNFELAYSFRFGAEYTFSNHMAVNATIELFGSESTWDWSPYDNKYSIFDNIPSINVGMKFNLLKNVYKYDIHNKTTRLEKVNHEFLAYGTRNTVKTYEQRIKELKNDIERIIGEAGDRGKFDSILIDSLKNEIGKLQKELDDIKKNPEANTPQNVFDELIQVNKVLNLPATIVYYKLDKYDLDYNARVRLQDFANKARNLDDTVEFYIIGAADSLTGSIPHNQWLSERRAEAAFNMLVNNYRLSPNQFIQVFAGGINERKPQEKNRMAMVIQRTPVTEEIVERWKRMSRERLR